MSNSQLEPSAQMEIPGETGETWIRSEDTDTDFLILIAIL